MQPDTGPERLADRIRGRDFLVFVLIILLSVVIIEALVITNASVPQRTYTTTATVTYFGTVTQSGDSASLVNPLDTITTTQGSDGASSPGLSSTAAGGGSPDGQSFIVIVPLASSPPAGLSSSSPSRGYSPDSIRVVIGVNNSVVWVNADNVTHSVDSAGAGFSSGPIHPGESFTFTFKTPGEYYYDCSDYPWMSGVVTVFDP